MWSPFRDSVFRWIRRINLNMWNDPPSCKRIPHESYEIIPLQKMISLNLIVLVLRTIDNRRGKLLTNLASPWMNRVGRGDSVKRGIGQQTQTNKRNHSEISHTITI